MSRVKQIKGGAAATAEQQKQQSETAQIDQKWRTNSKRSSEQSETDQGRSSSAHTLRGKKLARDRDTAAKGSN